MSLKHTSTPWEVDGLKTEGAHGKYTAYALLSPEGKVICDTINGGLQTEVVEHDEDGTSVYDAQGLADMKFAALAANNHDELVAFVRDHAKLDPVFAKGYQKDRIRLARELINKIDVEAAKP